MMLLNKDKPVVSVSALIHNTGAGGPQRTSWPGPLWSEHPTQHTGGVGVSGVTGMSGGGGGVGRHSPPLTPMEGLSSVPSASSGGGSFVGTPASNGPASPGLSSASFTLGSPCSSSGGGGGGFNSNSGGDMGPYPPKHPLYGSKNLCAICEDKASGKHYGVFSCEGCKGFFKRTVRKELTYTCRENRQCTIDKRHRNRCQHCRYNKCLCMGMKREAVQDDRERRPTNPRVARPLQEERQRNKRSASGAAEADVKEAVGEGVGGSALAMPIESIREAETAAEITEDKKPLLLKDGVPVMLGFAASTQLDQLVVWAKHIPHFRTLPVNDQMLLLKNGWNELLITAFSHRSIDCTEAIRLSEGVTVDRFNAEQIGVDKIFDRVLTELVAKMRDMKMDKVELGCLRTIVLYNPDVKGLSCPEHIDNLRERVYSTLEDYTKQRCPSETGRFPKLLLRLPALRSIGLQCLDHLFYYMMFVGTEALPMPDYLTTKLQQDDMNALSP